MAGVRCWLLALAGALLGACSSLPPGHDYPRSASLALDHPEETRLGRRFADAAAAQDGASGFRLVAMGVDGFLIRMQVIGAAQRTLDLQYFIFHGDDTGRLLTGAVLRAADRGVRVRILLDDGETESGDEQLNALAAHPSVQIRIFNPFAYRGHVGLLRGAEFLLDARRLDYRMHNKLLVVDNAVALVGGRNIGDQYFQVDPESQFADDDVFAAGPVARQLSATFDEFWNCPLAIPVAALGTTASPHAALKEQRQTLGRHEDGMKAEGVDYEQRVASGEPLGAILAGRLPLVWARSRLVYDSPEKKKVDQGEIAGRLMRKEVAAAARSVRSELLMVTPYLVPGEAGMRLFSQLRARGVRVRVLTNSLESATVLAAQAGYMKSRVGLLEAGVELHELRALLGNSRGSGQGAGISRYGNYSLHAKLFVFDRERVFIGSMNFDQRSLHLNTEIGLIIDSPELARQVASRFEAMVQPPNAYLPVLRPGPGSGGGPTLVWCTHEGGVDVELPREPARSPWQRFMAGFLSTLPIDDEL